MKLTKPSIWHLTGSAVRYSNGPVGRLMIKIPSYQYSDPHHKGKTIPRPSYLYDENPNICLERVSLYLRRDSHFPQQFTYMYWPLNQDSSDPTDDKVKTLGPGYGRRLGGIFIYISLNQICCSLIHFWVKFVAKGQIGSVLSLVPGDIVWINVSCDLWRPMALARSQRVNVNVEYYILLGLMMNYRCIKLLRVEHKHLDPWFLLLAWAICWINRRYTYDLRRHDAFDVTIMKPP